MRQRNARFWWYSDNGNWIKLTVKPDRPVSVFHKGPTDEGWSSSYNSWELDTEAGVLVWEWETDGRDCDGRLTQGGKLVCPLDRLTDGEAFDVGEGEPVAGVPSWQSEGSYQRDYSAEAIGY